MWMGRAGGRGDWRVCGGWEGLSAARGKGAFSQGIFTPIPSEPVPRGARPGSSRVGPGRAPHVNTNIYPAALAPRPPTQPSPLSS